MPGELAERLHFLGLAQMLLGPLPVGDLLEDHGVGPLELGRALPHPLLERVVQAAQLLLAVA